MAWSDQVGLGVRSISTEANTPGNPPLVAQEWVLEHSRVGPYVEWRVTHPRFGSIESAVVRVMYAGGKVGVYDQFIIAETPGAVLLPVRRIRSGKGEASDRIIVYLMIVDRPVVEPCLNVPQSERLGIIGSSRVRVTGIRSLELSRGNGSRGQFRPYEVDGLFREHRMRLFGNQDAFDASGGAEEFGEELPMLEIANSGPVLVGAYNANSGRFKNNQAEWIVPVQPVTNERLNELGGGLAQLELIRGVLPLRYPDEVDELLAATEAKVRIGEWDSETPVLVDGFTKSMLSQLGRLVRANRIPVTG